MRQWGQMTSTASLPLDLLVLSLLVSALLFFGSSFIVVVPLFFYLLVEIWHPIDPYAALPQKFGRGRLSFLLRLFLIWLIVAGATLLPLLRNITSRLVTEVNENNSSQVYGNIHDGAIQLEQALVLLAEGQNPYAASYRDVLSRYYELSGNPVPSEGVFDYFVYLPGYLLASLPFYQLFQALQLPYDQRWLYLLAYAVLILLLPTLVERPMLKLTLVAAVALNPLVAGPVILGMNDVLVLLFLVVAMAALRHQRLLLSAIVFGLACTLKQSAWFVAPFYVLLLYQILPRATRVRQTVRYLAVIALIVVAIIVPFALWSLPDFIADVFAYPGGAVAANYPIRGYTIGMFLLGTGLISTPLDPFPFWILQLGFGVPLLAWLLASQWRRGGPGATLVNAGAFIFGLGLVSRFFQENYVGFVVAIVSVGIVLNTPDFSDQKSVLPVGSASVVADAENHVD
jgi:hypothetical protein